MRETRVICDKCGREYTPHHAIMSRAGSELKVKLTPEGCDLCAGCMRSIVVRGAFRMSRSEEYAPAIRSSFPDPSSYDRGDWEWAEPSL